MIKPWFQLPTELEIICHLQLYLNMISAGYLCYWILKLDLMTYLPGFSGDATGIFDFARLVYLLSGFVAFIAMSNSYREKRRHWQFEMAYVAINFMIIFFWLIHYLYNVPFLPMS